MVKRRRRLLWWVGAVVVVLVVAALAGPFIYIHFIEGPPPPRLTLPSDTPTHSKADANATATPASLSGTWNVGSGSQAGYRVQEVLLGQSATAVGRTTAVWGSLTIGGTTVTDGTFTVNVGDIVSDQSERNASFRTKIMDVAAFPTATLTLTSPIALGTVPPEDVVRSYKATGTLDMHGVTKPVTFTVSAERVDGEIDALTDITIPFANWNISNPSVGGFVTTANNGTLEVLLHLTQGAGNPASTVTGNSGSGPGGPVTVPSTTVPPLTVPTR